MPTIEERKFELKQKRSDALMAKINVLRARDGSVAPPIDSMKDEDDFNLGLLFGASRNENISWGGMGVEGLIRCYYEIIYRLNGKVRNNIIKVGSYSGSPSSNHNTTSRSGLQSAVSWLSDGQGFKSGFYIGWDGLDTQANDEGNATKKQRLNNVLSMGRKGDMQVSMTDKWTSTLASQVGTELNSSSFTHNRDEQLRYNHSLKRLEWVFPEHKRSQSLLGRFDSLLDIIGSESPRGPHIRDFNWGQDPATWDQYVLEGTILAMRHRDVSPYQKQDAGRNKVYETETDPDTGSSSQVWTGDYDYTLGRTTFGDGNWDDFGDVPYPPGYTPTPDYWDPNYETTCSQIISKINDTINYINFTKIQNFTYFVNYRVIPGIDPSYNPDDPNSNIGSSWNLQNGWITQLEEIRDRVQYSLDYIQARKQTSTTTRVQSRNEVDNEIFQIKSLLSTWISDVTSLSNSIDSSTIFGDVANPLTLYGHRYMWIRTLIHATEGTMTAVNSTGLAITMMDKKLSKAEEELMMFGMLEDEWIPTPIIVGIEPYPVLNQATFEMEIGGWLVAWGGQEHCTGYDVWKSEDYDPATKSGTWTKIEVSNTQYTMSDVDANTGKVLTYIIDGNVEPIPTEVDPATVTHPYYKVKAYDINGGSGEYGRKNARSLECEPQNPAAFPFGAEGQIDTSGPRRTPEDRVTTTEAGSTIPPNTLFWVTNHTGESSKDFERRVFEAEAPFDSIGSNLIVFVDGRFKNQGPSDSGGDYELIDTYTIRFNESIALSSEVNIVVGLRSFSQDGGNNTNSVMVFGDLPMPGNDGDIYFVEEPAPGAWYQYFDPPGEWREVGNPNGASTWKDAINTFSQLPTQLNSDGDVRLVLDTSTLYRWDGSRSMWVKVSGVAGGGWLSPVDTFDDLEEVDTTTLSSGAIVFVISEEALYRWSSTQDSWLRIAGSNAASWKDPVNNVSFLPDSGNSEGDIRLVLDENKLYRWFSWEQEWKAAKANADVKHTELTEDDWESVTDHDARYYPRIDIDDAHNNIEQRLSVLESLKPKDAEKLSGDFNITGTTIFKGYLSEGDLLQYDTLQPRDYFTKIIKDNSFILSNNDPQQFRDGDKGILRCYINDEEVDSIDLSFWFNEDEREEMQSYVPQRGTHGIIEITSVGPYNQYPLYQRADFQVHITQNLLVQGENKIQLKHFVGNQTNDVNETDPFIVFWDEFDGEMGFKDVYIDEMELNSNKYLSGIRYYSIDDVFQLRFEAENLFNNTYVKNNQITIDGSNLATEKQEIDFESDGILGNPIPRINEDLYYLKNITVTENNVYSVNAQLNLIAKNPFKTYTQRKDTNILINTIDSKSTNLREDFYDELYRLPIDSYDSVPSSITGVWNSQLQLSNNDLMVFNKKLMYPQYNFSSYMPPSSINYSSFSGPKSYIRAFVDSNPHNNGKIYIKDFRDMDPNISVEIKLPSLTGWMSLNKLYNAVDFSGSDGDGIVMKNDGELYEWTSGEFSTANCGYMILLRITIHQKTNSIGFIEMMW